MAKTETETKAKTKKKPRAKPKLKPIPDGKRAISIKRIKELGELGQDLGLQQLTLGDLTLVYSPIIIANKQMESAPIIENIKTHEQLEDENTTTLDDEDKFFPEEPDPDDETMLFWSSEN